VNNSICNDFAEKLLCLPFGASLKAFFMASCLLNKNFFNHFFNQQKLYLMKKNFFRSSVVKSLVMSLVFAFSLFATNSLFAQTTPEKAVEVIRQELSTMKQEMSQQQATSLSGATAQAEIAAAVKYRFYELAEDYVQKYGTAQGVQETYNLFTENNTRASASVDAANAELSTLLGL